ncbi:MAG: hypothetical protein IJL63_04460 [Clostridia bacterium]|nr:hypothetical protein [Clostridia bacterium]
MINGYDFPEISYFIQKNTFTGSEGDSFRYRITYEEDKLKASVWHKDLCYELAEDITEEMFELSNDGLVKAIEWIFSIKKPQ